MLKYSKISEILCYPIEVRQRNVFAEMATSDMYSPRIDPDPEVIPKP